MNPTAVLRDSRLPSAKAARPVGVENSGHADIHVLHANIVKSQGLCYPLALIITRPLQAAVQAAGSNSHRKHSKTMFVKNSLEASVASLLSFTSAFGQRPNANSIDMTPVILALRSHLKATCQHAHKSHMPNPETLDYTSDYPGEHVAHVAQLRYQLK